MSNILDTSERVRQPIMPVLQKLDGKMTRELLLQPGRHGLGMTTEALQADSVLTSVCGYCATGCGLRMHVREGQAAGLTPQTNYPVNLGMACPKGWEALRVLDSPNRATIPLQRAANGQLEPVGWDAALREFCRNFKAIQNRHGNDSVAFLSTGQIASEEMAFLGALAKFGMGIKHGDGNTRQCMATAVTAYKESFGFDAPPYTYDDFEHSDCLVFIGANPCVGHPIMWERVLRNRKQPEILVLDPRRTETAMAATQHLQLSPKSDLCLLYAITRHLVHDRDCDAVREAIVDLGLHFTATHFRAGLVACTGSQGCKYAAANTKRNALEIADYLESRFELDVPINIHVTGCHHSCAQHYIGDIGLIATKVAVAEEMVDGYDIVVGGGWGTRQQIARGVVDKVPWDSAPQAVAAIVGVYLERRAPAESFNQFIAKQTDQALKELCCADRQTAKFS